MNDKLSHEENLISLRALTASKLSEMNTYNYRGFVGHVVRKGDLYVIREITGKTNIVGSGKTIEDALVNFEKAVCSNLRETAKDSQYKMLVRRFRKAEAIHSRVNSINKARLKRRVDNAK